MFIKTALYISVSLVASGTSVYAQNATDILNMFGGIMQSAVTQAAQVEWRKLSQNELSCVDQTLRQRGSDLQTAIRQGITPSDARIADIRAACRSTTAQDNSSDNSFYYVANTRPPDAYLSLRTNPTSAFGQRIMTMPNGTVLRVLRRQDDGWWYVKVVPSGQEGWALGRIENRVLIECCTTAAAVQPPDQSQQQSPASPSAAGPSFDCAKATYADERTICSNAELSQLDNVANAGYEYVRHARDNQYAKSITLPLLHARQACGSDAACIKEQQIAAINKFQALGAPISVPQTAQAQQLLWDHNGSTVYLVAQGRSRKFFYKEPKTEMLSAGAKSNSLLFDGKAIGEQYQGTAYQFNSRCGKLPYRVSGPILDNYRRVELRGQAPRVDNSCRVTGYVDDLLSFQLIEPNAASAATESTTPQSPPTPQPVVPKIPNSFAQSNPAKQPAVAQDIQRPVESQQGSPRISAPSNPIRGPTIAPERIQKVTKPEFSSLIQVPSSCQTARQLGAAQLTIPDPYTRRPLPGPACRAVIECRRILTSQISAALDYLKKYPAVMEALSAQHLNSETSADTQRRQKLFLELSGFMTYWGAQPIGSDCIREWNGVSETYGLPMRYGNFPIVRRGFDIFVEAGQGLLSSLKSKYEAERVEYSQLIEFVDRYPGIERLERAQGSYDATFQDEDVPGLLASRPDLETELQTARTRKALLVDQSDQLTKYGQTLSDLIADVSRESLIKFVASSTMATIEQIKTDLKSLGEHKPAQRGDVSQIINSIEFAPNRCSQIYCRCEETKGSNIAA